MFFKYNTFYQLFKVDRCVLLYLSGKKGNRVCAENYSQAFAICLLSSFTVDSRTDKWRKRKG